MCDPFVRADVDENGTPTALHFSNTDRFNFAFDIVDELGRQQPDKLAMLHISNDMGKPTPLYDVHLLDHDGREVATGETGEICINIQNGLPYGLCYEYYRDAEKTAETWHDGFYHTGDLAWKDEDGFFYYVGRADDVIKSSGYRIGPFEIENVIMDILFIVSQWPSVRIPHLRALTTARAIENQCFAVCCNSCGTAGETVYGGTSSIVNPWGETLALAGETEQTITADCDLSVVQNIRGTINVFRDRRPEIYSL